MQRYNYFRSNILQITFIIFLCATFFEIASIIPSWSMEKMDISEKKAMTIKKRLSPQQLSSSSSSISSEDSENSPPVYNGKGPYRPPLRLKEPSQFSPEPYRLPRKSKDSITLTSTTTMIKNNRLNSREYLAGEEENCKIYILFGYPGAGKGTFAEVLKKRGYTHFSTGDILREEVKNKTPFGLEYQQHIESSTQLLPSRIVESFFLEKINFMIENKKNFVLDGYPKTVEQAKYLDSCIEKNNLQKNVHIINLEIPLEVALSRIQHRRTCNECGKIYNLITAKPIIMDKCDLCRAPVVHRICDTKEKFNGRIHLFKETVSMVISYYQSKDTIKSMNSDVSLDSFITQILNYDLAQ